MARKIFMIVCLILLMINKGNSQPATHHDTVVNVNIDANSKQPPISKLIYGQFIELLFNYFEGGLWSEMLGDRKFFYPVNSNENLQPANSRKYLGRWKPLGPDEFVKMDSVHVYAGAHSVKILSEQGAKHGIKQSGINLQSGHAYVGYVILKSKPGVTVNVCLMADGIKQGSIGIGNAGNNAGYHKYPFKFIATTTTSNAVFEITGKGSAVFYIGAVSLMPADNISGFRADILNNLKEMHLGIIRWGGNASSGYNWRDGVGERDKRAPRYDYAWGAMESNDVGTDEYMTLCKLLNVEPYIGVNAGFGDAFSAAQWVQYVNGPVSTPMGKLRARNGHPKPYHVKWWGIGNEMYGEWQLGHMSIKYYTIKHKIFAGEMKKADPSIMIVASGASPFEMGSTSVYTSHPEIAKVPYSYDSEQDWSGNLLAKNADDMNFIAEHLYPISDSAYNEKTQKFEYVKDSLPQRIRRLPNRIKGAAEAYGEYVKRMPFVKEKNIFIALDEWRMKDGWGLEDALATAEGFNEIARHTDMIKMSAYTSTSAPLGLLYTATSSAIQPNGLTIKLYADHFGTIPISVSGDAEQPVIAGTTGADRPSVTSGSNTYPLDIMAALTSDHKKITIAVVNPTTRAQKLNIRYKNINVPSEGEKWTIAGHDLKAINNPGVTPDIKIVKSVVKNADQSLNADALSVTIFELEAE
ncbi:alpha-L-arabinofuranosidase C-terminal domain-containing protein [Mucilaginibacter sp. BT774]|uniref:alpha-L-arabinofuranosidase C-terminal domain-containing protein n=1 Tax=Mucilaginibacter sp. BT774 TaxID=3062276 RepID=UPI002674C1B8|nr:alpha-L-arabinofuranosidase C-terminal domain-containing protein [Mucilaginibacter sp. BT774]MDO3626201.1 alpha-L-arabinofuranosidase C-terminal domain-containing protein [Mucilaginibacter sp. BT774]